MGLSHVLSFQNVVVALFIVYLGFLVQTFRGILDPRSLLPETDPQSGAPLRRVQPQWERGSKFKVRTFAASTPRERPKKDDLVEIWSSGDLEFTEDAVAETNLNLTEDILGKRLWNALGTNHVLYIHFHFVPIKVDQHDFRDEMWVSAPAVRMVDEEAKRPKRFLARDWPLVGRYVPADPPAPRNPASGSVLHVGYWKPVASAHMVGDWTEWPIEFSPRTVVGYLKFGRKSRYLPVVYTDQLGLTKEKLVQVNKTDQNDPLPLHIQVGSLSIARWQFNAHMENTLQTQKMMGATDKDTDELRHMMTETEPTLLAVTMLVSLVHILLDILAFKSDVSFWANTESTQGLSVKTLVTDFISQVIITAYLHEQSASLLVLVPSAAWIFVQMWKIRRAFSIGGAGEETEQSDSTATRFLFMLLSPLVLGYAIYSFIREQHTGYYGWLVGSLASCVYAFGFIMMTPQIFINYKLKSVAHLPWKFFIYKAMNTFIDDLFAFIIRMPTMHRLSVFRDDIVFFIYMYQRYIYPVDYSRKHDDMDESDQDPSKQTSQESKKDR